MHHGQPPEDSYSGEEHLERFAPLHDIATALIEHLATTYDVSVDEDSYVLDGLLHTPSHEETVRAVRLTPSHEASAPLIVVLTNYPSVMIFAGALYRAHFPSCGCNACDETWHHAADELEWQTFAIAGGGFSEAVSRRKRAKWQIVRGIGLVRGMGQTVFHDLKALDGSTGLSGESRAKDVPAELLRSAQTRLDAVARVSTGGNWLPWSLRN